MYRKAPLVILAVFMLTCSIADAAFLGIGRKGGRKGGMFPEDGEIPELMMEGKVLTYKGDKFQELYGAAGNRYIQFGMIEMMSANYIHGAPKRRVNIEIATMETPIAAAGLFHHHRGKILSGQGENLDVGAEGVLDIGREKRNLYFYRANYFVKIVYSGKPPIPSLLPIAEFIDDQLPAGRDEKPAGFKYIDIEGINPETIALTPGFTFNISFMPPSVWASAPAGGSPASDLFVLTRVKDSEAAELYRDYSAYLRLHAEYIEEYESGGRRLVKAVDPNQGRVLFTNYKNVLIIAARPDGYDKGEVLIDRVIERINDDQNISGESGGKRERRSILPWRRRKGADRKEPAEPARTKKASRDEPEEQVEYDDGFGDFSDFKSIGPADGEDGVFESIDNWDDDDAWDEDESQDDPGAPFFLPPPPAG